MHLKRSSLGTVLVGAVALASASAWAQHEERGGHMEMRHEAPEFHGDIARFHEHDWAVWHQGHWFHGAHEGRLGWWWIAGGVWFFYPYPIYPWPDPYLPPDLPVPAEPPPPTPSSWYYCSSAKGYYPYVTACPEGWRPVAPTNTAPPPR